MIIHICGASGSGKTTLGNKLKEKFGNKIVVKDLDDLRDEFIRYYYGNKKWKYIDHIEYQKYIDSFIKKQKKPLIFVGLNDNMFDGKKGLELYYNLYSQHNYYIKLDDETIIRQKCIRFFDSIKNNEYAMNDLIKNNNTFIKQISIGIKSECNAKNTIKDNKKWNKYYAKQGYIFDTRDHIFKKVSNILKKIT